jgi:uncharacterized Zn finger protein
MGWYGGFAPYVSVAERRKAAARKVAQLKKKGHDVKPVQIEGRMIAKTFWGKAWCDNLESYSDFENRLPRGRTYVRNGSVIDLHLKSGKIEALVSGSEIYKVNITVSGLPPASWKTLVNQCAGQFDSMVDLLQGKFSQAVMTVITQPEEGLFPRPKEIKLGCSCPDYADLCKHTAAVLYGVGARLDETPELLFLLRKVNQNDLLIKAGKQLSKTPAPSKAKTLKNTDLSALFGISLEADQKQKSTVKKLAKKKK